MSTAAKGSKSRTIFLITIVTAIVIDAVLLAVVRADFTHQYGFDDRGVRRAVAKPAPP